MQYRNDGIGESNILQNQFTAYLTSALRRAKLQFLRLKEKQKQYEISSELQEYLSEFQSNPDMLVSLPLLEQIENDILQQALQKLKERDRYILFAKIFDERTFEELSSELGIGYKGITAIYYRMLAKIRKELEEAKNEF